MNQRIKAKVLRDANHPKRAALLASCEDRVTRYIRAESQRLGLDPERCGSYAFLWPRKIAWYLQYFPRV